MGGWGAAIIVPADGILSNTDTARFGDWMVLNADDATWGVQVLARPGPAKAVREPEEARRIRDAGRDSPAS